MWVMQTFCVVKLHFSRKSHSSRLRYFMAWQNLTNLFWSWFVQEPAATFNIVSTWSALNIITLPLIRQKEGRGNCSLLHLILLLIRLEKKLHPPHPPNQKPHPYHRCPPHRQTPLHHLPATFPASSGFQLARLTADHCKNNDDEEENCWNHEWWLWWWWKQCLCFCHVDNDDVSEFLKKKLRRT